MSFCVSVEEEIGTGTGSVEITESVVDANNTASASPRETNGSVTKKLLFFWKLKFT